ncbi:MAG TPA: alpha-hydroxy-acid oxidizing protein [Candidatus Methylomirabilis sp.]|nr:alpha-hydroxy-acid oxidizing protein [Candidatus Methylomirabilis sp.]
MLQPGGLTWVLLKGILHPDDALQAAIRRVDGIVVCHHGGLQVEGAIAALDAPSRRVPVLSDSGIRGGCMP